MSSFDGRIYFPDPTNPMMDLPSWLAAYPPDRPIKGCDWLQVRKPDPAASVNPKGSEEAQHAILRKLASLGNKRLTTATKKDYLQQLCDAAYDTCGKWMLFVAPDRIRNVWAEIAAKVMTGDLGHSAKVTCGLNPGQETYLICCYVPDFRAKVNVRRVLRELLRLESNVTITSGFKVTPTTSRVAMQLLIRGA